MVGAIVVLTVGAGAAYLFTVSSSTVKTLKTTYTSVGKTDTTQTLKATKPLTIVLLGVDTGGVGRGTANSWQGNSDSQIVMTLNPKTDTTTMVSMERDTMTNILDGNGKIISKQKMNAAYPYGYNAGGITSAAQYAMNTIGQQAGVNVTNFVAMNFDGLINLVDDVGGIEVVNDTNGQDALKGTSKGQMVTLPTGETVASGAIYISDTEPAYTAYVPYYPDNRLQLLNGQQALVFARDRHTLGNGDYGRQAHQRAVLSALMKKIVALDNITQYQKFLSDISQDMKTNIPINGSTLASLIAYKDCFKKVVSIQYQGVGMTAQGASYQFMPENVDLAVQNAMRSSLGEPTETTLGNDIITYESYYGTSADSQGYLMPSATVTENGKATVYGINTDGSLVTIDSSNSGKYISTTGNPVVSNATSTSGTSSSSSTDTTGSSSTGATNTSSTTTSTSQKPVPAGLTPTGTAGVYTSPKGYTVYYKNGSYVYTDGTLYPGQ